MGPVLEREQSVLFKHLGPVRGRSERRKMFARGWRGLGGRGGGSSVQSNSSSRAGGVGRGHAGFVSGPSPRRALSLVFLKPGVAAV